MIKFNNKIKKKDIKKSQKIQLVNLIFLLYNKKYKK